MVTGGRVAVVTDSTASLPAGAAELLGITVVPLLVVIDGIEHREGVDLSPTELVAALSTGAQVTTAHAGPEAFGRAYLAAAAHGAGSVVSVHLSHELSGTVQAARLAAERAPVPVHVVDSHSVGMGLGLGVLAAARWLAEPAGRAGSPQEAAAWAGTLAAERSAGASVHFSVEGLEQLRRGGRLGAVAATVGTVLGLRPLIALRDGRLEMVERARTALRARERLIELAMADAAARERYDVAVHHLDQPGLAGALVARIRAVAPPGLGEIHVAEISAVIGAHVGPGLAAVVVADA